MLIAIPFVSTGHPAAFALTSALRHWRTYTEVDGCGSALLAAIAICPLAASTNCPLAVTDVAKRSLVAIVGAGGRVLDRHFWGTGLRLSPLCAGVAYVGHCANP